MNLEIDNSARTGNVDRVAAVHLRCYHAVITRLLSPASQGAHMVGNGKVFVSHTHDNNDRCLPLLAALDAWGIDNWFDTQRMIAVHRL